MPIQRMRSVALDYIDNTFRPNGFMTEIWESNGLNDILELNDPTLKDYGYWITEFIVDANFCQ